jgi:hypothetical protein
MRSSGNEEVCVLPLFSSSSSNRDGVREAAEAKGGGGGGGGAGEGRES